MPSGRFRLRPEECAFIALLGFIAVLHVALWEPLFVLNQLMELWIEQPLFRVGVVLAAVVIPLSCFAVWLMGPTVRHAAGRLLGLVRDFAPFGYMFICYEAIHALGPKLHHGAFDELLVRADEILVGCQGFVEMPSSIFQLSMVRPITFYFAFSYSVVFVVYAGLAMYFRFCAPRQVFRKYVLSVCLTSFLGYSIYMLIPGVGPYEAFVRPGFADFGQWSNFTELQAISRFADSIRLMHFDSMPASDAFPSLHTAWAIIVLGFTWSRARWLLLLSVPWALGTVLGAIYFQQHYLIDVLAAIPAAFAGSAAASFLVNWQERSTQKRFVL